MILRLIVVFTSNCRRHYFKDRLVIHCRCFPQSFTMYSFLALDVDKRHYMILPVTVVEWEKGN